MAKRLMISRSQLCTSLVFLLLAVCCTVRGKLQVISRGCEEIYVVGEGETLHTISDKCGDPFIVEQNPHINDPDDVFPGLGFVLDN
ncbi:hypothetical protein ACS0TY_019948 [Phlomoides rotata]